MEDAGFANFTVKRFNLFNYIFLKSLRDFFSIKVDSSNKILHFISLLLVSVDSFFAKHFKFYSNNLRNLVWSFEKPNITKKGC